MKTNINKILIILSFIFFGFVVITLLHNKRENFEIDLVIEYPLITDIENIFNNSVYFKNFNAKDKIARQLDNRNVADIIKYYIKHIHMLTDNEKTKIKDFISNTIFNLPTYNQKKFLIDNWNIIAFNNLENNYPHTHGDSIMMPYRLLKNISKKDTELMNTFIHEQVHVDQRKNSYKYHDLYTNFWNFKLIELDNVDWENIKRKVRSNPDVENLNWVFSYNNTNIVLLALFNDNPSNLSSVTYYGVYLDDNFQLQQPLKMKPLNSIPDFNLFFGNISNNHYHPNEITAEIIAAHCMAHKKNISSSLKKCKAYKNFLNWWNKLE